MLQLQRSLLALLVHFKDRVLSSAALQTVLGLDLTLRVEFLQSSELQLMLSG